MSKLFKLREWLTVAEAAAHLSGVCGEVISEAHVLRLGLDRHLTLSVDLVNHAHARMGSVVPFEKAQTFIFPRIGEDFTEERFQKLGKLSFRTVGDGDDGLPNDVIRGLKDGSLHRIITDFDIGGNQFIHWEDRVMTIRGQWDLAMIGAEKLDIEHSYQQMTGGPDVKLTCLNGVFLKARNGDFAQLQESLKSPDMQALLAEFPEKLRDRTLKRSVDTSENSKPLDHPDHWLPAGGLPQDAVIVVRTSALREFEERIADETPKPAKESVREKNNLLRIIGLMANHRYTKDVAKPYSIAAHLTKTGRELGVDISDETIAQQIKAALALLKSEKP